MDTCQHPRCQGEMVYPGNGLRDSAEPSTKPDGWNSEHDTFVRLSAKSGEDPKSILQLLETEFSSADRESG